MNTEWIPVRLDELTEPDSPITYGVVKPGDSGEVSFIRGGDIADGRVLDKQLRTITSEVSDQYKRTLLRGGELLICLVGQPGQVAVAPPALAGANIARQVGLIRLRSKTNPRFVSYFLQSPNGQASLGMHTGGSVQQVINLADLRTVRIPIPSLAEQERIVSILDKAVAGIATAKASAEKNLQHARALFESHLQSVFTQRGRGWVDRQLASLCHEITVGHVGPMKTQYQESGIPFLRSQNIRPFEVSLENVIFIDEKFHRALKKSQLRPGDLAIVRTGYPGTAAVIPLELPDSNCSDLVIVRPSKEVNPHFLAAFFNSAFGKRLVLGKIVGAAQKHFNITAAKEVMLHVPPMTEQRSIIQKVDQLRNATQRLASVYGRKLAALEALKKSLLHQAFTGQL